MAEKTPSEEIAALTFRELSPTVDGEGLPLRASYYDWFLAHWIVKALKREETKRPKLIRARHTMITLVRTEFRDILLALFHKHLKVINELRAEDGLPVIEPLKPKK